MKTILKFSFVFIFFVCMGMDAHASVRFNLAAGATYVKEGRAITIGNSTPYTGVFVQQDVNGHYVSLDLIHGTSASWFASHYTDYSEWGNTLRNTWDQTRAVFSGDLDRLGPLQQRHTEARISPNAVSGRFSIGGWVSLVCDSAAILFNAMPLPDGMGAQVTKDAILAVVLDQQLVLEIRGLINEGHLKQAITKAMVKMFRAAIETLAGQAGNSIASETLQALAAHYGLSLAADGVTLVGGALDVIDTFALGVDAVAQSAAQLINYYSGNQVPVLNSSIPINLNGSRLEQRVFFAHF